MFSVREDKDIDVKGKVRGVGASRCKILVEKGKVGMKE